MIEILVKIKCPHCHHGREYNDDGSAKRPQVRCPNCKGRYYVSSNVIKENKKLPEIKMNDSTTDLSILRSFYLIVTEKSHRGTKKEIIEELITHLEKEKEFL